MHACFKGTIRKKYIFSFHHCENCNDATTASQLPLRSASCMPPVSRALISPASFFLLLSLSSVLLSSAQFLLQPFVLTLAQCGFPRQYKDPTALLLLKIKIKKKKRVKVRPLSFNLPVCVQYSSKLKRRKYFTPHTMGFTLKVDVKGINKKCELSGAELADRLDVGQFQTSRLDEKTETRACLPP